MTVSEEKKRIRREMKQAREKLSPEQISSFSKILADRLLATDAYRRARTIYVYLSYSKEVRTEKIIRKALEDGKRVAAPKICGREMVFYRIKGLEGLEKNALGIPEPADCSEPVTDEQALVVVPGLAFDRQGSRIGYGGGYYDRYFAGNKRGKNCPPDHPARDQQGGNGGLFFAALCYDFQLVDRLPADERDITMDLVIPVNGEAVTVS